MATKKKPQSVLGLSNPPQMRVNGELTMPGSSLGAKRTLTRAEMATVDEYHHHKLVEYAVKLKTNFGTSMIGDINLHGNQVFHETLDEIVDRKQRKRDPEHQVIVDEFTLHNQSLLAQGLLSGVEGGTMAVLEEILRPLYVEVKDELSPQPRSFWDWLFGR